MKTIQVPKFLADMDYLILTCVFLLIGIGILSIASAGVDADGFRFSNEYLKQIIWAVSGFILMLIAVSLDISRLKDYFIFAYLFILLILIYTRLAGRVVNGARAWLGVGDYGIQPSEFAKIITILFLARYLDAAEMESSF
ncbi:MAG: FtsW/RodA/SpoVE family cell cycle protein, partial [Spirochaetia bacterium]|nr:FtsW/RodA/SpoVE family cell cycle protein [Spirochaetia bacterium]